jgi:ABC-2 type transport system permease protein
MNLSLLTMSVKKELWEFNKLLFWVPIIIIAMMVAAPLLQLMIIEDYQWNGIIDGLTRLQNQEVTQELARVSFAAISGLFMPFMMVALLIQLYYFLVCLFDERRDMSIYFWRSMPVSDATAISTKLLTGALVIPGIFMLAATVTLVLALVLAFIGCIALSVGYDISIWHVWGSLELFTNVSLVWLSLIPFVLWLFPLFAWLMLMSMFANKAPFLWALLPIIILVLVEAFVVHYFDLNSSFFIQILTDYFGINEDTLQNNFNHEANMRLMPIKVLMSKISVVAIAVGAGLMYLTYWLRVNRSHA